MSLELNIIPTNLLVQYVANFNSSIQEDFESLCDSDLSIESFSFYTSVSAVFSSKIEGEPIEMDSYIKHKRFGVEFLPDYTIKIDDLYDAYLLAQNNLPTQKNISLAHSKITKHILKKTQQGKMRIGNMFVVTKDGKIEYVAVSPEIVNSEMNKLYKDLDLLVKADLSFEETFFYASMIHLVFVKIHPFEDGNGRTARLLEKWFLAQKLGEKAWWIQSEKNYYDQHSNYYKNIRRLGLEYDELNFNEAMYFLQMLPNSLKKD